MTRFSTLFIGLLSLTFCGCSLKPRTIHLNDYTPTSASIEVSENSGLQLLFVNGEKLTNPFKGQVVKATVAPGEVTVRARYMRTHSVGAIFTPTYTSYSYQCFDFTFDAAPSHEYWIDHKVDGNKIGMWVVDGKTKEIVSRGTVSKTMWCKDALMMTSGV